jgi:hypothetical protein
MSFFYKRKEENKIARTQNPSAHLKAGDNTIT